jgi:hypothetical protein
LSEAAESMVSKPCAKAAVRPTSPSLKDFKI